MHNCNRWSGSRTFLFFALWCFSSLALATHSAVDVSRLEESRLSLTEYFSILEDRTTRLALDEVRKSEAAAHFQSGQSPSAALALGFTESAYWLRLKLANPSDIPVDTMLEITMPRHASVQFHQPDLRGGFSTVDTGYAKPYADRPYKHRYFVFPVSIPGNTEHEVFLRFQGPDGMDIPAYLWPRDSFHVHERNDYMLQAAYFGIVLAMVILNLLLFLFLRDQTYLLYVIYVCFMALNVFSADGVAFEYLWGNSPRWAELSTLVSGSLALIFLIFFVSSMLNTKVLTPRCHRLLYLAVGVQIAVIVGLIISFQGTLRFALMSYPITGLLIWAFSFKLALMKQRSAVFFLLAFTLLAVALVVTVLRSFGILPLNALTHQAMQIGSALEMLLLALALADRFNTTRSENAAIRTRILVTQAESDTLRAAQQQYREVIEHLDEGMLVIQDNQVGFANECAARILGVSRETLVQQGLTPYIDPEYRELFLHRISSRGEGKELPNHYEMQAQRADGRKVWLQAGDAKLPLVDAPRVLVFFSDLTERKKAEVESLAALEHQRDLIQLRSRFVEMCSHEFRSPLSVILATQELILERGDQLGETKRVNFLQNIGVAARSMTKMLDQVLLLSKAEAHMLDFRPYPLNLHELLQNFVETARLNQPTSRCTVRIEFSVEPPVGNYDPQLLRIIFGNLLSNAIKYSPLAGEIVVRAYREQDSAVIQVLDQGIGIPESDLPQLFLSFHRASNVGSISGTGLGLAIVKSAVERHGGTIQVWSEVGHGTSFTVHLPLQNETAR